MFTSTRRFVVAAPFALASIASGAVSTAADSDDQDKRDRSHERSAGAVFALSNASAANRIFVNRRGDGGQFKRGGSVRTRAVGIGTALDTQGGLRLGPDNRFLCAA